MGRKSALFGIPLFYCYHCYCTPPGVLYYGINIAPAAPDAFCARALARDVGTWSILMHASILIRVFVSLSNINYGHGSDYSFNKPEEHNRLFVSLNKLILSSLVYLEVLI